MLESKKQIRFLTYGLLILMIFGPWIFNGNSGEKIPLIIEESSIGYYQTNTCEFSMGEILKDNLFNREVEYLPDLNSKMKCHGRINGVDSSPEEIKVYIGTNLNIDLIIQSMTWLIFLTLIPKTKKKNFGMSRKIIPVGAVILFYVHINGERFYYEVFSREFDLALSINNFFILSIMASTFFISIIFQDLIQDRFYNLINYFPYIFLFIGAYNSYNLNFFLLILSIFGIVAIIERKINIKFTLIYVCLSSIVLIAFEGSNNLFDVDKLKGFSNSSETISSIVFWIVAFYLTTSGIVFVINENLPHIDLKLIRYNFLMAGCAVFITGIISSVSPFINFMSYYYFGLNKLGMNTLQSVEGNTWRGIGASAEALGEFYAFCIIFTIVTSYFYKHKITRTELLLICLNLAALYRTNNAAAVISGLALGILYLLDFKVQKLKNKLLILFLLVLTTVLSFEQITDFDYKYASRSLLYEGMAITKIDTELGSNEIGKNAIDNSNFGEILLLDTSKISSSLLFVTKFYTETSDIKYIPNPVALVSAISVPINRSQKWGVFFGKYNPTVSEFLFGYGPQQINRYYLNFDTKINTGLVLPHSSVLSYLVFFGITGVLVFLFYILYLLYRHKENRVYCLLSIFFLLNLVKSDSVLYLQNFTLIVFVVNFYKIKKNVEGDNDE